MNIIFGRHDGCTTDFCWEVPDYFKDKIHKGDILLVDTIRGEDVATAVSDIISGEGAQFVADKNGAYFPLKKVLSYANQRLIIYLDNKIKNDIIANIKCSNISDSDYCDIPF
jgi:hypothetical protein